LNAALAVPRIITEAGGSGGAVGEAVGAAGGEAAADRRRRI